MYYFAFRRFAPPDSRYHGLEQFVPQLSSHLPEEATVLAHRCPSDTPKLLDCTPDPCTAWFAESKAAADWTTGLAGEEFQLCARAFSTSAHRSAINVGWSSMMSRIRVRQADSIPARTVSSPAAATNSPRDASSLFSTDIGTAPARPKIRTKPCFTHDHASVAIAVTSADDAALIKSSTTAPSIPSRTPVSALMYGSADSDSSRPLASPAPLCADRRRSWRLGNRPGGRYGRTTPPDRSHLLRLLLSTRPRR